VKTQWIAEMVQQHLRGDQLWQRQNHPHQQDLESLAERDATQHRKMNVTQSAGMNTMEQLEGFACSVFPLKGGNYTKDRV
jgi:hypothetical protein